MYNNAIIVDHIRIKKNHKAINHCIMVHHRVIISYILCAMIWACYRTHNERVSFPLSFNTSRTDNVIFKFVRSHLAAEFVSKRYFFSHFLHLGPGALNGTLYTQTLSNNYLYRLCRSLRLKISIITPSENL